MKPLGGVAAALGSIGALAAGLLLVLRKGPIAALMVVLAISVVIFALSVVQAVIGRKKGS